MKNITDCKGRDMNGKIILYGNFSNINESKMNDVVEHTFMSRIGGRTPKGGKYYLPEELEAALKHGHFKSVSCINSNFRNVQYIFNDDETQLFWVYAIKETNLHGFKFVGSEMSIGVLDKLMRCHGYKVGYAHVETDRNSTDKEITKIYFNQLRSIAAAFSYRFAHDGWTVVGTTVVYRKFESSKVEETDYTGFLFDNKVQTASIYRQEDVEKMGLMWNDQIWLEHFPIYEVYDIRKVKIDKETMEKDLEENKKYIDDFEGFRKCFGIV